ncbi:MAG: hypothetical protein LDLANPLL_02307 [Turneriella sp.]|nr:hypothetical protein [Turneriella sp.]
MKLGNPTKAQWPQETIPMNARVFASGFWNYSFFQFNRKFLPPYWAEKQYNPASRSFLPRSHNVLSINQTHRNWIGIGFPGRSLEASVDMAGSIMVYPGSYTVEFATLENERVLRPQSDEKNVEINLKSSYQIECKWQGITITYTATECGIEFQAKGNKPLLFSVRPFNFEGPALIYKLHYNEKKMHLTGDVDFTFNAAPSRFLLSNRQSGDALRRIAAQMRNPQEGDLEVSDIKDTTGLSTASFFFDKADTLSGHIEDHQGDILPNAFQMKSAAEIVDVFFGKTLNAHLYKDYGTWLRHAKEHLIALWDFDSIKPGSYTYHHFWIRDAVIMMYALLLLGAHKAVKPIIERFTNMVKPSGLFASQSGEWDANGQALWILAKYTTYTHDTSIVDKMQKQIGRMLGWFERTLTDNCGVLPPGFSAEHLGPADWYLWDNFWALGGLKEILPYIQNTELNVRAQNLYTSLVENLKCYLEAYAYFPAALGRTKDAGMIGSVIVGYPLELSEFCDERFLRTLSIIHENYFFNGCFFQENIHSGLNPYLTLQMAESYLYIGKTSQARKILRTIKDRAQKAYTYPEAINIRTRGGCMGDGFHGWASAEAIIIIRNLIVREVTLQDKKRALIWLSGFRNKWLEAGASVENIYTPHSTASLRLKDKVLHLSNISKEETHIFSLPVGYDAYYEKTNTPLQKIPPSHILLHLSDERTYYLLDKHDGDVRLKLVQRKCL